jgi:hypothetical protein
MNLGRNVLNDSLRVFIGYEPKQPLAYTVLHHSIVRNSSVPVSITPLILSQLPLKRRGLTEFTYSRFLVPWLCEFRGTALFLDADMVVTGDIAELFKLCGMKSVYVMQDQARFEWASAMLFNCGACKNLTPTFVENPENKMFDLEWAVSVGELPKEWNHCVGYTDPVESKLYHFTQGIPCFYETRGLEEDDIWEQEWQHAKHSVSWKELMGKSIHAEPVLSRMLERYK